MTDRTIYRADDANNAEMIIDCVPEHLLAGRAPIQFIVTDELNGPNSIVCANFTPETARKIAATLLEYANFAEAAR